MTGFFDALRNARYLHPQAVWLLVPVAIVTVVALARRQRLLPIALRLLAALLLVAALADPVREQQQLHQELSALVDVSYSISPRARAAFLAALEPFVNENTALTVLPFGAQPARRPAVITAPWNP